MATAKAELEKILKNQPDDSSAEEIIRELTFHVMVEKGLGDADAGRVITNAEMARKIRLWQR